MNNYTHQFFELKGKVGELNRLLNFIGNPHFGEVLDRRETYIVLAIGMQSSNMKQLSEYLQENYSTMTGIIDRMEKKAVITRSSDPSDRRAVKVSLTKKWRRKYIRFNEKQEARARIAYDAVTQERFNLLLKVLAETNDCISQKFALTKKNDI